MNPNSPPGPTLTRGSPRSPIRPPRVGDHHVPVRRQVRGVAAGAAGSVESDPDREAVEDLVHDGLFDVEEFIPRLVVERCPPVVAFARRDGTRFDPLAQLLGRIQERLDFAEPGEGEVPVVHAGERPEQSYAFQAEEIRQRMLVDHGASMREYSSITPRSRAAPRGRARLNAGPSSTGVVTCGGLESPPSGPTQGGPRT